MTLRDTVRNQQAFVGGVGGALNVNLHSDNWRDKGGAGVVTAPASVLLRTVGLVALTHREHTDANALAARVTPDMLKVFPDNDYLLLFSNGGNPFPNIWIRNESIGKLGTIIANSELAPNKINGKAPTVVNYAAHFNRAAGAPAIVQGGNVPAVLPTFGDAANVNPAIIFADLNDTILRQDGNHRVNLAADPVNGGGALNFVDEVNCMHNAYKKLTWNNIGVVRGRFGAADTYPNDKVDNMVTSIPNSQGAITVTITKNGNFGAGKIENCADYNSRTRQIKTIKRFMWDLTPHLGARLGTQQPGNSIVIQDALLYRDWYRFECFREPAALITNAMFFTLATSAAGNGYRGFGTWYNFTGIRERMPMAPTGTVEVCRDLWRKIMWGRRDNSPIYYLYDYTTGDKDSSIIIDMENNLLFNYITWKAGISDLNNLFTLNRADQINRLTNVGLAGGVALLPIPFVVNIAANPNLYIRTTNINGQAQANPLIPGDYITIEARFPVGGGPLTMGSVVITSFPLRLIFDLLNQWYNVDLAAANPGLANLQIDIDLGLK